MMVFLEKPWKTWENRDTSTLWQLKQEGIIWYQNETLAQQIFFSKNLLTIELKKQIWISQSIQVYQCRKFKRFAMIMWNQNIEKKQNYVTWIKAAL